VNKWRSEQPYDILKSDNEAWAEAWADYFGNGSKRIPDYVKTYIEERLVLAESIGNRFDNL